MKRLFLLATLALAPLAADWCDGEWEVGAEALYFRPMVCPWDFAASQINGQNEVFSISPDYDWGFRVGGGYQTDCTFVEASYLWLQTRDSRDLSVTAGLLVNPRGRLKYRYQNVDVRLGQILHQGRGCNFALFGNARWVDLEECRKTDGIVTVDEEVFHIRKSQFNGGGLGVGLIGDFCLFNDFSAFGVFNAVAVIGERKLDNRVDFLGNPNVGIYPNHTCVIPALDIRIGFEYSWECGGVSTNWRIGYEMDYYWVALRTVEGDFNVNEGVSTVTRCDNVGFAGPFAGVSILF